MTTVNCASCSAIIDSITASYSKEGRLICKACEARQTIQTGDKRASTAIFVDRKEMELGRDIVRRASWIAYGVIFLGAALIGWPFVGISGGDPEPFGVKLAVAVGPLVASICISQIHVWRGRALPYTIMGTAIGSALITIMLPFLRGGSGDSHLFILLVFYAAFVAFIGAIIGAILSIPVAFVNWAAGQPSRATLYWIVLGMSTWLTLMALAHIAMVPYSLGESGSWLGVTAGSTALAAVFASAVALVARAAWLARVRRDKVPGYEIVSVQDVTAEAELLPWAPGCGRDAVLVRRQRVIEGAAYRSGAPPYEQLAYVDNEI